jgi:hypothetical protein
MSTAKLEQIRCPCGEAFEADIYNSINAEEDPDLKEALICGDINVVCCPKCSQIFYAEHFVLYHDPSVELVAFVYPSSFKSDEKYWKSRMEDDFEKATAATPRAAKIMYAPIILFGLDDLVQLIKEEDELGDEISVLNYSAGDIGIDVINLSPSLARRYKLPRCIPSMASAAGRENHPRAGVIAGLKALIGFNPNLTWYAKLLDIIEKDHRWALPHHAKHKK